MKISWLDPLIFLFAAIGGFFLIPRHVFFENFAVLAWIYLPFFALTITCLARNLLARARAARNAGSSFLGIVSTAVGITALQACGLGMPACGSALGVFFGLALVPGFVAAFVRDYAPLLIFISIIFQAIALYSLGCFNRFAHLHPENRPEPDAKNINQRYRGRHKPAGKSQE